tara:strand:- start:1637 stop:2140 length:504 start_codon:yes stop_codon:yes gene_type:complete
MTSTKGSQNNSFNKRSYRFFDFLPAIFFWLILASPVICFYYLPSLSGLKFHTAEEARKKCWVELGEVLRGKKFYAGTDYETEETILSEIVDKGEIVDRRCVFKPFKSIGRRSNGFWWGYVEVLYRPKKMGRYYDTPRLERKQVVKNLFVERKRWDKKYEIIEAQFER